MSVEVSNVHECELNIQNKENHIHELRQYSLWTYEPYSQYLLKEYKKGGNKIAGIFLAQVFCRILAQQFNSEKIILIPMPSNPKHKRELGFDHMQFIVKLLCQETQQQIQSFFLLKRRESEAQKSLSSEERKRNMEKSLYINTRVYKKFLTYIEKNKGVGQFEEPRQSVLVVIIDDVITTGATIIQAYKLIVNNLQRSILSHTDVAGTVAHAKDSDTNEAHSISLKPNNKAMFQNIAHIQVHAISLIRTEY